MRVVGLMLASNNVENRKSYMDMVTACKETWIKNRHENVEIMATWGKTYQPYITQKIPQGEWILTQENDILINTEERRENLLIKTIKGIECALQRWDDIDYFFRPNCGSYVETTLLYEFLENQPREKYYGGIIGENQGYQYVSGACTIFSRDLAELIVENQDKMNLDGWKMMDDVSIGKFMSEISVTPVNTKQRVMANSESDLLANFDPNCYHHYFCHTINPKLIYKCQELFDENR